MSEKVPTSGSRLPGNDGAWFLKAAGVDTAATELGDVSGDGESTSELVRELWAADPGQEDLSSWTPGELSKQVRRKRNFRWPMVAVVLLLIAAAAGIALWLPGTSENRAADVAGRYEQAYSDLYADLAPAQQALADYTEPDAAPADGGEATAVVTELQTNAGDALVLATTPIPTAYPFAPDEPFERLAPHRESLSMQATSAEAVARRIGDLIDYRTVAQRLFVLGELPTQRQGARVNALSERLAAASADTATALDELPEDAAFAAHKDAVREALTRFTDWQVEYVEAIRLDHRTGAETLVAEWEAISDEMDALLVNALAQVRSEVDGDIIDLAGSIDQSLADLESP